MDDVEHKHRLRIGKPKEQELFEQRHLALLGLNETAKKTLSEYLMHRIKLGQPDRLSRFRRFHTIDRAISTWQRLDPSDTKRLDNEEATGAQTAIKSNLPILAAHLEDLTAFYTDTLAPSATPFVSNTIDQNMKETLVRLTKDVLARNYYSQVAATARSLIKYNIGGMIVSWDEGSGVSMSLSGVKTPGNSYISADMHNICWDPTVRDPSAVASQAEWASYTRSTNRIEILRRSAKGSWVDVDEVLTPNKHNETGGVLGMNLWVDPAKAIPSADGSDSKTTNGNYDEPDWASLGLGISSDYSSDLEGDRFELTVMYAWIVPFEHGLLSKADEEQINDAQQQPDRFIELWRFELLNNWHIVSATPQTPRERTLTGESTVIPFFLNYLTQDHTGAAQRSPMELVLPFQRLASSMFAIGTESLRKNVWGTKFVDPSMFDLASLQSGATAQVLASKIPGRDVRTGFAAADNSTGAEQAFSHVDGIMGLKNVLFPSQSMPAQIAGIDRAVTSQVSTIVHGAQRGLRMSLHLADASIFRPARMETVRNLQRYEPGTADDLEDEQIAKELGSGVESLESERITEALWRLMMAIVQNQEANQAFDVPKILGFLGDTLRVGTDMSTFAKAPPPPPTGPAPGSPGGGQPSPEELALMAEAQAQGGM